MEVSDCRESREEIYLAEFESAHFSFRAIGTDRASALEAMTQAAIAHSLQFALHMPSWFEPNDVTVTKMQLFGATRDGEPIHNAI